MRVLAEMCPAQWVTWTTCRLFLGKCGLLIIAKQKPGYEASIIVTTGAIIMHVACMCQCLHLTLNNAWKSC